MALKKIVLNGQVIELPSGGSGEPYIIDFDSLPTELSVEEVRTLHNEIFQAYSDKREILGKYNYTLLQPCIKLVNINFAIFAFYVVDDIGFISSLQFFVGINSGEWTIVPGTPTSTSQLDNDSGFLTSGDIATINGQSLTEGGDITISGGAGNVPTKTSDLTNDSGFITANDNVASATKLQTTRYINGAPFNGSANAINYAVCSTAASTTAKAVSISRFSLVTGAQVRVKFSYANTASAPTLNVGSSGAKRMSYKGSLITNANFSFSTAKIYTFTYDGTYWVLEGDWDEAPKTFRDLTNNNFITGQFAGEVGDVIYSTDDQNSIEHIENWIDELGMGKVCVLDYDEDYYSSVIAFNFRTDANFGMGRCHFSYIFDGYLYDVEHESVSLPVTLTIVGKTKLSNADKQDKLVSGTNIKTINGQSLLGSGNITIEGGSGGSSSGPSAYAEVSHGTSNTTFELTPNTFHVWDEVAELNLSLGAETSGVANEYLFQFTSGSEPTTLALPDNLKWANVSAPAIASNMIYQVSILKGLASVLEFSDEATGGSIFPVTLQYGKNGEVGIAVFNALYSDTTLQDGDFSFIYEDTTYNVVDYEFDYDKFIIYILEEGPFRREFYLDSSGIVSSTLW